MALSASDALKQIGALLTEEAFQAFNPVIGATLNDIAQNPAQWTNPATAVIKGAAAVANLMAAVPNLESTATTGAAQLVASLWVAVNAKVATDLANLTPATPAAPVSIPAVNTAVTAGAIGSEIAGAIAGAATPGQQLSSTGM